MLLLVGLGNPGSQYTRNRHNVGFMAVEMIARRHHFPRWRRDFQGVATEGTIASERVLLLLPGTYMNESGRAVAEAARYYDLVPSRIVVFHDDLQRPFGRLQARTGGGLAGHNGLRSISAYLGTSDYRRVRIGIGRPAHKAMVERYVLQDFTSDERFWVQTLCEIVADRIDLLIESGDELFEREVNLIMESKGFRLSKGSF